MKDMITIEPSVEPVLYNEQKPIYNTIPEQHLMHANELTLYKWNDYINQLSKQTNNISEILELCARKNKTIIQTNIEPVYQEHQLYILTENTANFHKGDIIYGDSDGSKYIRLVQGVTSLDITLSELRQLISSNQNTINNILTKVIPDLEQRLQGQITANQNIINNELRVNIKDLLAADVSIRASIKANKDIINTLVPVIDTHTASISALDTSVSNLQNIQGNSTLVTTVKELRDVTGDSILTKKINSISTQSTQNTILIEHIRDLTDNSILNTTVTNNKTAIKDIQDMKGESILNTSVANKINKDLSLLENLAIISDDDIFISQKGKTLGYVTGAQLKSALGGTKDYFKGDYPTLKKLQEAYPTANAGEYAYVSDSKDKLIMYVWDEDAKKWKKTNTTEYVELAVYNAAINNKVDKVTGKGLSTNDFTTEYKDKIDTLGALSPATETMLGGVKASPKTAADIQEVKIGDDQKLYVAVPEESITFREVE